MTVGARRRSRLEMPMVRIATRQDPAGPVTLAIAGKCNGGCLGELRRAIQKARSKTAKGRVTASAMKQDLSRLIEMEPEARLDYIEFFNSDTLEPVHKISKGTQIALAVFIGKTRLIDNGRL